MMFVFDVSIHNFVVSRRGFTLGRFMISIFNICPSSVLMIRFNWTLKLRVIWMRHFGTFGGKITAACAGNTDYR